MDIPTTLTSTQLLLIWMLVGLLLAWMTVFAMLALRPEPGKNSEPEHGSWSTGAFPQLHVIVQPQTERSTLGIQLEATAASTSNVAR